MKLQPYKKIVVFVYASVLLLLTGCSQSTLPENAESKISGIDYNAIYTLTEADTDVSAENAQEVVFDGEQTVFLIEKPGDYLLKGNYEGQLQIDAQDRIVHLIMDDVEMKSQNGPAIYVKSAAKVIITIPEESACILMDSTNYADFADAKACIYGADDLTINGGGSLQVYGYYKDAIRTKDTLKILGINLAVQAKDTGLRGNDGVVIQSKTLDIQCEGTGIYTEKESKANRGFVDVANGTVSIIAGEYGINASENVYVHDCTANITGIVQDIACLGEQYIEEGCLE